MPAIDRNDVISLNPVESLTGTPTAIVEEHVNVIRQALGGTAEKLLDEGIETRYLKTVGGNGQWQTGRLKLVFEFVPTPPAATANPPSSK